MNATRKSGFLRSIVCTGVVCLALWMAGCQATPTLPVLPATPTAQPPAKTFDGGAAYQHVQAQMALGPRPVGTDARKATANYIIAQLEAMGWSVERQVFEHQGVALENVIAKSGAGQKPILLGAHYDTRSRADKDSEHPNDPVPGANDGASGVAVLLELARVVDRSTLKSPVWLVFFDGEDRGRIAGWEFSVGARYMATHLTVAPQAVVVADMIGDADQQVYMEIGSEPALSQELWGVARQLGIATFYAETKWSLIDDHLPFKEQGIPAALLIDFDYPYWHTTQDTLDKVSPSSLENIGRVLKTWVEQR